MTRYQIEQTSRHQEGAATRAAIASAARDLDTTPEPERQAWRRYGEHAGGCPQFLLGQECATCAALRPDPPAEAEVRS